MCLVCDKSKNRKPHLQPTAFNASMRAPWLGLQMWLFLV